MSWFKRCPLYINIRVIPQIRAEKLNTLISRSHQCVQQHHIKLHRLCQRTCKTNTTEQWKTFSLRTFIKDGADLSTQPPRFPLFLNLVLGRLHLGVHAIHQRVCTFNVRFQAYCAANVVVPRISGSLISGRDTSYTGMREYYYILCIFECQKNATKRQYTLIVDYLCNNYQ